ncbi:MAG: hypothetical protein QG588_974 [Candidatus Poribacteria bacterium]|nr:hypothetical protein [Candidatus Poribacteria bacterium]
MTSIEYGAFGISERYSTGFASIPLDTIRTVTKAYDAILIRLSIIGTFFVITEFISSYHFQFGHRYTSNTVLNPANIISHF